VPAAAAIHTLIVDDQQTMRSLVRNGLHTIGIVNTREAPDGEAALRDVITRSANLVIADYNMPKLDGLGLLRAMRAHEPTRNIAFIMLTGRADRELLQRASQYGVNNFLVKPFTVAQLRQKIEEVFGTIT
jgi:two-component system, chemotaxis family, chemotaxis protein CheY